MTRKGETTDRDAVPILAGGPLAQLVEQGTFNPKVAGSNPARPMRRVLLIMNFRCLDGRPRRACAYRGSTGAKDGHRASGSRRARSGRSSEVVSHVGPIHLRGLGRVLPASAHVVTVMSVSAIRDVPEQGQLVQVRERRWVVVDVQAERVPFRLNAANDARAASADRPAPTRRWYQPRLSRCDTLGEHCSFRPRRP